MWKRLASLLAALSCLAFAVPAAAQSQDVSAHNVTFVKPSLSFDIPGLQFSDIVQKNGVLEVNYIAEYITAAYRLLMGISVTVAIVMVMVGGVQYVLGAGTGDVKAAKERIKNAVVGLILMLSVYVILFTVNPQLTLLPAITIKSIPPVPEETEPDVTSGTLATDFNAPQGANIRGGGAATIPSDLTAAVEAAAKRLDQDGYGMAIASSFRSVEDQTALILKNCQNPPGSASCNPKPGRPQTCILKDNNPANCPHTTGRALDIWATKKRDDGTYIQCVKQDDCLKNMQSCFADPCQKALIDAMRAEGFCSLSIEAWHFEKPRMSSGCN